MLNEQPDDRSTCLMAADFESMGVLVGVLLLGVGGSG